MRQTDKQTDRQTEKGKVPLKGEKGKSPPWKENFGVTRGEEFPPSNLRRYIMISNGMKTSQHKRAEVCLWYIVRFHKSW